MVFIGQFFTSFETQFDLLFINTMEYSENQEPRNIIKQKPNYTFCKQKYGGSKFMFCGVYYSLYKTIFFFKRRNICFYVLIY